MEENQRRKTKKRKLYSYYDYSLLFLTLILVCFGLVMVYSTSYYSAMRDEKIADSLYYLKRQAMGAGLGFVAMFVVSKINYQRFIKPLPTIKIKPVTLFYLFCMGLQIFTLFFGTELNGAKRWIKIPGFGTFQPSDLSKVALILFTAYIIYAKPRALEKLSGFIRVIIYCGPLVALVAVENLSTAIVMGLIFVGIAFVSSSKKLYFIGMGGLLGAAGLAFVFLGEGFRAERFQIWMDVENHKKGFQILQGLYAIASGGLTGTGLGGSMQKLGYVPEAQNDMIFAIICEELGLLGAVTVIMLFAMMLIRIFLIAVRSPDLFGGLVCTGVLIHIAAQVIFNIAVVTNSIPSTGMALPFISYGGTSMVFMLIEVGIVLSVSNQIRSGG